MPQEISTSPEIELVDHDAGTVRYVEHGVPSPLIRWHVHDNYELHLTVSTRGKAFVGDHIGTFSPGQLVLTGPRLPHNWVTVGEESAPLRDQVIQFNPDTMSKAQSLLPELGQIRPLLDRSLYGIEFVGMPLKESRTRFDAVRDASGLDRLLVFLEYLRDLAEWPDYRLLSTVQVDSQASESAQRKINTVIDYVLANYAQRISLTDAANLINMSESYFSRFYRKTTGHRFVDLVNRVRISRACAMLIETDKQIALICHEVGFNNVANFNRQFQRLKGATPREYRQQALARQPAALYKAEVRSGRQFA